jgi:nucleotide-binding universal stress UspA family protein
MTNFNKILVAMDASPMSDRVFEQALSLAKQNQASLMLLHVLSGEEEDSPLPIPPNMNDFYWSPGSEITLETWRKQWETFESECLEQLRKCAAKANTAGISAEFRQIAGSPGRTICTLARTWEADLIVIGHRGRSGLSELFLGSVSNYVLHHSPCSVITVKSPVKQRT